MNRTNRTRLLIETESRRNDKPPGSARATSPAAEQAVPLPSLSGGVVACGEEHGVQTSSPETGAATAGSPGHPYEQTLRSTARMKSR